MKIIKISAILIAVIFYLSSCKKKESSSIVNHSTSGTFTFSFSDQSINGHIVQGGIIDINGSKYLSIGGNSGENSPEEILEVLIKMPTGKITVGDYLTGSPSNKITYMSMYAPDSYNTYESSSETSTQINFKIISHSIESGVEYFSCAFDGEISRTPSNTIYSISNGIINCSIL